MVLYAVLIISAILPLLVYNVVDTAGSSIIVQAKMEKLNTVAFDEPNEIIEAMNYFKYVMREHNLNTYDLQKGIHCSLDESQKSGESATGILSCSSEAKAAAKDLLSWRGFSAKGKLRVVGVSELNAPQSWVDVQMCRDTNGDEVFAGRENQILRLRLGSRAGFRNALSGDDMKCVFCHAQIYGNLIQYKKEMTNDLHSLEIFGSWLSANPVPPVNDPPLISHAPKLGTFVNGTSSHINFSGSSDGYYHSHEVGYEGRAASWDYRKQQKSLPKVDPHSMQAISYGKLSGGQIQVVPIGGTYPSVQAYNGSSVVEGNLIINGTGSPVTLQGMVFVSGDIMIWGKYTGQGTLVAGGNIYIPNELEAVNLPSVLDGTASSNNILKDVANPIKAKQIADAHVDADRLLLMSTNNTIVGTPFPSTGNFVDIPTTFGTQKMWKTEKGVGDLRYLINVGLRLYQHDLAYEKATGHMVDVSLISNVPCRALPWERKDDCLMPGEVDKKYKTNRTHYEFGDLMGSEDNYRAISNKSLIPEGYVLNFFPMNVVDKDTGEKKLWISKEDYANIAKDPKDHATWMDRSQVCGSSKRVIDLTFTSDEHTYPVGIDSQAAWFSEAEKAMDFDAKYANLRITKFQELGWDSSKIYTGREVWDRFKTLCQAASKSKTPKPSMSSSGFKFVQNFERPQYNWVNPPYDKKFCDSERSQKPEDMFFSGNWPNASLTNSVDLTRENGIYPGGGTMPESSEKYEGLVCEFFMKPDANCTTGEAFFQINIKGSNSTAKNNCYTGVDGDSTYLGKKAESCYRRLVRRDYKEAKYNGDNVCTNTHTESYSCTDSDGNPDTCYKEVCDEWCATSKGYKAKCWRCEEYPSKNAPNYIYTWENSPYKPLGPRDNEYNSYVKLEPTPYETTSSIKVSSSMISPAYQSALVNNKVERIDAFMLANQFWSHQSDTFTDRTLEINGGVSAKEMVGRFSSKVGRDRDDIPSRYSYWLWNGANFLDLAIIMRFDPRYQYTDELIYDDFGALEFSKISETLTCE